MSSTESELEKAADSMFNKDDFELILTCAVRYVIGRATYMPSVVIGFITPLIHTLSKRTLAVMLIDISEAPSLGMEIDKEMWLTFSAALDAEYKRRKDEDREDASIPDPFA